uniref:Retrovirus-related Pol polyprotein from transposon TNT 1-94 n=1 Tax=Tanacetum cinerariifolium TaxID=118510 RepID=A0A699IVY2_TANCI|nr:retrovirus-related Pol polyprotein from transposon TNT 1-94 [Tanacetum cinerariifolium]
MKEIKNKYDTNVMYDISKDAGKLQIYVCQHPIDLSMVLISNNGSLEESFVDSIYKTEKKKSFISTTPLSTAFFSISIVQDFQDSPDDKEDKKSSQEYMDDLGEEYQEKDLLAKSKKFFKKGTQRPNKDFKAKYNKVKAKLALLSLSASASKASMVKKKGLIVKAYELDEEKVSSDDNEMV